MEDCAPYTSEDYRTCPACFWTGRLDYFETVPALPGTIDLVRCPYCGATSAVSSGTLKKEGSSLPPKFKIISGGQTGVDRAALDAALLLGIPHGGWCPKGRKAEDGIIAAKYNLTEHDESSYWKRTEKNIMDSDGTLIMPAMTMSKGTALTIRLARKHGKPTAIVPITSPQAGNPLMAWIKTTKILTLNVAGPRESFSPGIGKKALNILLKNFGYQSLQSASRTSTLFK